MITYCNLWKTMKKKGISQYALYTFYDINRSQLHRLRKNQDVRVSTINHLCQILHCQVADIMEYVEEESF